MERMIRALDGYFAKNDYASAERLLLDRYAESERRGDLRMGIFVCNELMGLYRKRSDREQALRFSELAIAKTEAFGGAESVGGATTYLNAATVCKAFGMPERAIPLFERAERIYHASLPASDPRWGGLYNNMGLAFVDLGDYARARECYRNALSVMQSVANAQGERAITYLNLASAAEAEFGLSDGADEINAQMQCARRLLDDPSVVRDGNYAFVCEKCASVFGYYGDEEFALQLKERAEKIYAGT